MITIYRTFDQAYIKHLWSKEGMYEHVVDDDSVSLDNFIPDINPKTTYWLVPIVDTEVAGCIRFDMVNNVMANSHIFLYKKFRGEVARDIGKLCLEYMRVMAGVKKFIGLTDANKPYIAKFAQDIGFKKIHVLENSWLKNGELRSQDLLECD